MKYTHIIWDFNGTIYSDMTTGIVSVNQMLAERGLEIIPDIESYREIFDFPIENYYRRLGFDFEKEPYSVLAPIWVDLYNKNNYLSTLVEGVRETLDQIKALGLSQVIISACEQGMLERDLNKLCIADHFDKILGLDNIHAVSKTHIAKEFARQNPDAKMLFVGDTTHDAQVAMAIGADCLLFSGGHQSAERLLKCGFPVIDRITQLIDHI